MFFAPIHTILCRLFKHKTSDKQNNFLKRQEEDAIANSTATQTKTWVSKFRIFLEKERYTVCFEEVSNSVLNDYLRLFYSKLRTNKGTYYAPASLVCIRAVIQRHFTSAECNKNVNILTGEDFKRANGVLRAMGKLYLQCNQDKEQFERISKSDMEKLKEYFF